MCQAKSTLSELLCAPLHSMGLESSSKTLGSLKPYESDTAWGHFPGGRGKIGKEATCLEPWTAEYAPGHPKGKEQPSPSWRAWRAAVQLWRRKHPTGCSHPAEDLWDSILLEGLGAYSLPSPTSGSYVKNCGLKPLLHQLPWNLKSPVYLGDICQYFSLWGWRHLFEARGTCVLRSGLLTTESCWDQWQFSPGGTSAQPALQKCTKRRRICFFKYFLGNSLETHSK